MNYFLLKLAFDTAVHFGGSDSAVGSQSSALTLRADTIFSALCHTALEVYGEPALEELLVSADADALRISDAMPWRGDTFYLPKPIAASTSPAELSTVERKAVKKLAWIPASKFDRYTASLHSGTYPLDELWPGLRADQGQRDRRCRRQAVLCRPVPPARRLRPVCSVCL